MKATREQVLAMAGEAMLSKAEAVFWVEEIEALVHLAQQFTLDQLRAQDAEVTHHGFGHYTAHVPLNQEQSLYRIPETLK